MQNCRTNGNYVVGISKTTKLKVLEQIASSLIRNNCSSYIDVESIVRALVSNVVGRPLLAKLTGDGLVLRADVLDEPNEPLGRLLTNDALSHGYPETLKLAHHVSTFTRMDMSCIRSFIISKFGMREIMYEDKRRTLLGGLCVRDV